MITSYGTQDVAIEDIMRYVPWLLVEGEENEEDSGIEQLVAEIYPDKIEPIHERLTNVVYGENPQEGILDNYGPNIIDYLERRQQELGDFSGRVPGKHLNTFPSSGNDDLFGFTYLGDNRAWRRDDLSGEFAHEVDIHECIHTPDEYETRVLTSWIMDLKRKDNYVR